MSAHYRYTAAPSADRNDWANIRALLPYLWEYRGRVMLALGCLVLAKVANVGVPLALKGLVDRLDVSADQVLVALPMGLLLAYGLAKLGSSLFGELRDVLFTRVRYRAMRRLTLRTLEHLHRLSLRFHLERKTGAISRDLARGAASLSTILNYMAFSILPVAVEFILVGGILLSQYDAVFAVVIFASVAAYIAFTFAVINWRLEYRLAMNRFESEASNQAIESLMNYETVKYFGNERLEVERNDRTLEQWEANAVKSQASISVLNFGQAAIIAVGVTVVMFFAAAEVIDGNMSIGDFVLVNAFLLQLFMPLGFLGMVYRQMRHSLTDMDQLVKLLDEQPEITDKPDARELEVTRGEVRFEHVDFAYQPERPILHDVDFTILPGQKLAVVGHSGAGKSTLARLLFRFYDVSGGRILIDGQDIRDVSQASLRASIGIVPQDTVLFNESIEYNLRYARPDASFDEIIETARLAQLHDFVVSLPEGYDTRVGERGLKLSGGEKQRVAIARAILKRPQILIFDEATSALDSHAEQAILGALKQASRGHSTLVIAHRLSTIVDAEQILVMDAGRIIERGTHQELLAAQGRYAEMWILQQKERVAEDGDA
ncbi:MAG TPA: ABC transporter ATP-binding protein/permease [Chromatiales bacterium]|nr:ABC transporter ATP-binding protein/permease [Chromatiales bacterium]HEX22254.1 ABC transporter ATP-binding protein/permease [Chromatiales bacterium]